MVTLIENNRTVMDYTDDEFKEILDLRIDSIACYQIEDYLLEGISLSNIDDTIFMEKVRVKLRNRKGGSKIPEQVIRQDARDIFRKHMIMLRTWMINNRCRRGIRTKYSHPDAITKDGIPVEIKFYSDYSNHRRFSKQLLKHCYGSKTKSCYLLMITPRTVIEEEQPVLIELFKK